MALQQSRYMKRLLQNKFDPDRVKKTLIEHHQNKQKHFRRRPLELKGVYNGQFYRIPLNTNKKKSSSLLPPIPAVPQIPVTFASPFCSYKPVYSRQIATLASFSYQDFWWRFGKWWKQNWATVLMNVGSMCTLIGFTRSDVLELRIFSMTGNVSAVIYNLAQKQIRVPSVVWISTFAAVNMSKIAKIVDERQTLLELDEEQEEVYRKFFLPHGVTHKQFEAMSEKAKLLRLEKGDVLVEKGEKFSNVCLIVDGLTRANCSAGRRLTAISFAEEHHETKQGGASGAWVGEIAFLQNLWRKRENKNSFAGIAARGRGVVSDNDNDNGKDTVMLAASPMQEEPAEPPVGSDHAMFSIVAEEDSTVMVWSFRDMEELMARSPDMRAAMTRAITAAIVGKVVNLTNPTPKPTTTSWYEGWKARVWSRIGDECAHNRGE